MDNEKTRDQLVKEMEEKIKSGSIEYMNEIAMPGIKNIVKEDK